MECDEICTQVWCGVKPIFKNYLTPPLKNFAGITSNSLTHRQSEASNFEMAQHIDKQKLYLSSTMNELKTVPNIAPRVFDAI